MQDCHIEQLTKELNELDLRREAIVSELDIRREAIVSRIERLREEQVSNVRVTSDTPLCQESRGCEKSRYQAYE